MRLELIALGLLMASPAAAQQSPKPPTPSQMALQIDNLVNAWATTIEQQQAQIEELQRQLAATKKDEPAK